MSNMRTTSYRAMDATSITRSDGGNRLIEDRTAWPAYGSLKSSGVAKRASSLVQITGPGRDRTLADRYPLTAPAVRPAMIFRWRISTRTINGMVTTTEAAMIVPQGRSY
jgi:hypothetical protein